MCVLGRLLIGMSGGTRFPCHYRQANFCIRCATARQRRAVDGGPRSAEETPTTRIRSPFRSSLMCPYHLTPVDVQLIYFPSRAATISSPEPCLVRSISTGDRAPVHFSLTYVLGSHPSRLAATFLHFQTLYMTELVLMRTLHACPSIISPV